MDMVISPFTLLSTSATAISGAKTRHATGLPACDDARMSPVVLKVPPSWRTSLWPST